MDTELIFQPFGIDGTPKTLGSRLIEELRSRRYRRFLAAVAFATSTGTSRICEALKEFTDGGGDALVFCGLSNGVTSKQAMKHLLDAGAKVAGFDLGSRNIFHGKVYGFTGDEHGLLIVGSNNLTKDGLFRHVEVSAALRLDPRVDAERRLLQEPYDFVDWARHNHSANIFDVTDPSCDDMLDKLLDEAVERPKVSGEVDDEEDGNDTSGPGVPAIHIPAAPPPGALFAPFRRRPARAPAATPAVPAPAVAVHVPVAPSLFPMPAVTPAATLAVAAVSVAPQISVKSESFPGNFLFAPGATTPTIGAAALSGRPLPNNASGLIVRVSGDTARIFAGEGGTANMTVPTGAIETLRFGIQGRKKYPNRPRAEFDLRVRYIAANQILLHGDVEDANVMPYGYLPGEPGNKDIRLVIARAIGDFATPITDAGFVLPSEGDYAFLEWPTAADPVFGLSLLQPGSLLATQAEKLFATEPHVGNNACPLPVDLSPAW